MKKNILNKTHIEGRVYDHELEVKVTGEKSKVPGTTYITGTVNIATDEACLNIVPVHFSFVTETTKKGTPNATFAALKDIIDGVAPCVMGSGADKARKVRVDSAIALNEFYTERDNKEEFVSVKRNEGGFVHFCDTLLEDEDMRNTFDVDMLITGTRRIEANPDKNIPEKVIVKGAVFDYANSLLPVEFAIASEGGMDYFESLEASPKNPTFTRIRGNQISETITTTKEEPSAFGKPMIKTTTTSRKEFLINWAQPEPYMWDDESTITVAELNDAITKREILLASKKQEREAYKAQKAAPIAPVASAFNF
jgi:hypothetical protein